MSSGTGNTAKRHDQGAPAQHDDVNSSTTAVACSWSPSLLANLLDSGQSLVESGPRDRAPAPSRSSKKLPRQNPDDNFPVGYVRVRTPEKPRPQPRPSTPPHALPALTSQPERNPFRLPHQKLPKSPRRTTRRRKKAKRSPSTSPALKRLRIVSKAELYSRQPLLPAPIPRHLRLPPLLNLTRALDLVEDESFDTFDDSVLSQSPETADTEITSELGPETPGYRPCTPMNCDETREVVIQGQIGGTCPSYSGYMKEKRYQEEASHEHGYNDYGRFESPSPPREMKVVCIELQRRRDLEQQRSAQLQDIRMQQARDRYDDKYLRSWSMGLRSPKNSDENRDRRDATAAASSTMGSPTQRYFPSQYESIAAYARAVDGNNSQLYAREAVSAELEENDMAPCGCCKKWELGRTPMTGHFKEFKCRRKGRYVVGIRTGNGA